MSAALKASLALLCLPMLAVGLAACGNTVSTAGFQGEAHEVAQAISRLQSDATTGEDQKICTDDLASTVVARLGGSTAQAGAAPSASAQAACRQAIKNQLTEVDRFDVTVQSVQVTTTGGRRTASARVKSTYEGKSRAGTLSLVKEGGAWKIAAIG